MAPNLQLGVPDLAAPLAVTVPQDQAAPTPPPQAAPTPAPAPQAGTPQQTTQVAPLAQNIMQHTQVANQLNPGPGNWASNMIAGVQSALAGLGNIGQVPPGAGGLYGAGKVLQAQQAQKQQQFDNKQKMRQEARADQQQQIEMAKLAPTIAETVSRTAANTAQAERLGVETIKDQIAMGRPAIERAQESGLYDRGGVTQDEINKGIKDKTITPHMVGTADGFTIDDKGKPQATFALFKNPDTPVKLEQKDVDNFKENNVPGFTAIDKVAPGQQIPMAQYAQATAAASSNKLFESTVNSVFDTNKMPKPDDKAMNDIMKTPGMVPAVQTFSHYLNATGGDPYLALKAMSATQRMNPTTGQVETNPDAVNSGKILNAFGGWDNLHKYSQTVEQSKEQQLKTASPDPKQLDTFVNTTLPSLVSIPVKERAAYTQEAKDARTQDELEKVREKVDTTAKTYTMSNTQKSMAKDAKDVTRQDMIAKQLQPVWTKDGFSDTLQQANQIKQAAAQAKDGNGLMTAMLPTMEVLGINMAGKIRRISPTEYDAAKTNPEIITRWNQMFDAAGSGASTAQIVQQANQLGDMLTNESHKKAVRNSQIIADEFKEPYGSVVAMDHRGGITTLDKVVQPAGAVARVPTKDGSAFYWVDANKKVLGVSP